MSDVISIGDLVPDPNNARKHNPRNVGMIVDALQELGAGRPIVIDEQDTILAGNATADAAIEAQMTDAIIIDAEGDELIAVVREGLTPEQEMRLALFDNRAAELAEWDGVVLTGMAKEFPDVVGDAFYTDELERVDDFQLEEEKPKAAAGGASTHESEENNDEDRQDEQQQQRTTVATLAFETTDELDAFCQYLVWLKGKYRAIETHVERFLHDAEVAMSEAGDGE